MGEEVRIMERSIDEEGEQGGRVGGCTQRVSSSAKR